MCESLFDTLRETRQGASQRPVVGWSACLVSGDECIMSDEAVECAQPAAPPPPPEQPLLLNVCSLNPITTFRISCADFHVGSCVGRAKVRDGGKWSACLVNGERCTMHDVRIDCSMLSVVCRQQVAPVVQPR